MALKILVFLDFDPFGILAVRNLTQHFGFRDLDVLDFSFSGFWFIQHFGSRDFNRDPFRQWNSSTNLWNHLLRICRTNSIPVASITDRGICGFGLSRNPVLDGVVWIRAEYRNPNTYIERLVIRFYTYVTNATLRHLATCSPRLKYLDVTGTGITPQGIEEFKLLKPECTVVAEYLPSQFLKWKN